MKAETQSVLVLALKSWLEHDYRLLAKQDLLLLPAAIKSSDEASCETQFHDAMTAKAFDLAGAIVVAAFIGIVSDGRNFNRFDKWLNRAEQLIQLEQGMLLPVTVAALEVYQSLVSLFFNSSLSNIKSRFSSISAKIEQSDSDAMRIMFAAITAYIYFLSGKLHASEEVGKDALHIAPDQEDGVIPKLFLAAFIGLTDTYRWQPKLSEERFSKLIAQAYPQPFPEMVVLMARCFRLMCLAQLGLTNRLEAEAEHIRALVIPAHKYFPHSFMHYSLGVSALLSNKPSEALTHANTALELAGFCGSALAQNMAEFLLMQSTTELQPGDKTVAQWHEFISKWLAMGYLLLVAAGFTELANLYLQLGRVAKARQAFQLAVDALPLGEPLPDLHRPLGFAASLKKRLLPETAEPATENSHPVRISTLGDLKLTIGNQVIYDRDWHGNKTKTLLKAIIVLGGKKVPAQRLCDLLWPDSDSVQASQNLKVALWRLKRVGVKKNEVPIPWLVVQHGMISLVSAVCEVDALRFMEIVELEGDLYLEEAIRLYKGDFLANDDSEPWIVAFREKLYARYLDLMKRSRQTITSSSRGDYNMWLFNS